MHAYDRSLFWMTLRLSAVGVLVAGGVIVLTDEAQSTVAMRLARLGILLPALSGLAAAAVVARAATRGEGVGLAALGVPPGRVARGPLLAGWLLALVGVLLTAGPWADQSALFPVFTPSLGWAVQEGRFVAAQQGVVVDLARHGGAFAFVTPSAPARGAAAPGADALLAVVLPLALAAAPWALARVSVLTRLTSGLLALALSVVVLHAVAAERASGLGLLAPALPLALVAVAGSSKEWRAGSVQRARRLPKPGRLLEKPQ